MNLKYFRFFLFLLFASIPTLTFPCKDAILRKDYPIRNFDEFDYILIVKIIESQHSEKYRYNPLVFFKANVIEVLKGNVEVNSTINGKPKNEEAHAVCPVHLYKNGIYLLLLTKNNDLYEISRFSFPVQSDNEYFDNYVSYIKNVLNK